MLKDFGSVGCMHSISGDMEREKYLSTGIKYFRIGAKATGAFGAFSLYNAHAFEEQATGKWDTIGIATDVVTNTTTISNNPFTEFILDESIGNAVDGARGK